VIKEHSVSVMVKNFHWTTFDVNQWIDDHIARWDEVSLVPRKREMNITPRAAAASLRYRKPWDVQYEAGRRLNDHRWVCIWQLEKGWMDPDIDWRAIGRELADCSAGWRPLMQKLMRAFVVESKWRDAMNDKSANSAPVGHYTLPDGRVITFNPPPLSARGRKRKQRHRAA
jgi:hypothetical protein